MPDQTADTFQCGQCNRIFAWKPELAGQRVACTCGATIAVPIAAPVAVEAASPAPVMAIPVAPSAPQYSTTTYASLPPYSQGYATYGGNPARPGILMAVAIISILMGCLSALVSGCSASLWSQFSVISSPHAGASPAPLPPAGFQPYSGSVFTPGGYSAPVRAKIISEVGNKTSLSPEQTRMLDSLLAEDGVDILPGRTGDALTPQPSNGSSTVEFKVAQKMLKVGPDTASYDSPNEEGWVSVTGNVVQRYSAKDGVTENWTAAALEAGLAQIRTQTPGVANMQLGFILNQLQDPKNGAPPGTLQPNALPLVKASMEAGNVLDVTINSVDYKVLPDGRGLKIDADHPDLNAATGAPVPPPTTFNQVIPGDTHLMHMMYLHGMAMVALAMGLIAAGIVTIIRPSLWAWMHMPYVALKLISIAIEVGLVISYFASIANGGSDAGRNELLMLCILPVIYPLVLVILYLANPRLRRMPS